MKTTNDPRIATIKQAELKLLHTVAFIVGLFYLATMLTKTDTTWYGWGLLISFSAFCAAIVYRFIQDLRKGEL